MDFDSLDSPGAGSACGSNDEDDEGVDDDDPKPNIVDVW